MITTAKRFTQLNFEDEENMLNSIKIIRAEYIRKAIKALLFICLIAVIAINYLCFTFLYNFNNNPLIYQTSESSFTFNLTISWILLSTSIFLVLYLIRLIMFKFTPSIVNYFKQEANNTGFKFTKRSDSVFLFFILNVISLLILVYLDTKVIQFPNNELGVFLKLLFLLYLILNLILPIVWAFSKDGFVIKINKNFMILCNLRYKLYKNKNKSPFFLGVLLTSNKLCSKFNKSGQSIFSYISEYRWLKRKKTSIISPYLQFQEFSIPVNFQKQFLNIVMALNEWENNYSNNFDTLNSYFSHFFPYRNYEINKTIDRIKQDQILYFKFLRF